MKNSNTSQNSTESLKRADLLGVAVIALIMGAALFMPHPAKADASSNKTGCKQTSTCTPTPTPPNE